MRLQGAFTVPAPSGDVLDRLADLDLLAACLPGATVTARDGETCEGVLALRLGPRAATFAGRVRIVEVDHAGGTVRLEAAGSRSPGGSDARTTVTARVREHESGGSHVTVTSDAAVDGEVERRGPDRLERAGAQVLDQLTCNLEAALTGTAEPLPAAARAASAPPATARAAATAAPAGPVGAAQARRVLPWALALLGAALAAWLLAGRPSPGGRRERR